jgi:hypothetical protein
LCLLADKAMTPTQAKTLAVLMRYLKPHTRLPTAADLEDGCYAAGSEGTTILAIVEALNLWNARRATPQGTGRVLASLVQLGYVARVFTPGWPSPRYVPTAAGAAVHRGSTPDPSEMTILELIRVRNPNHFTQRALSDARQSAIWILVRTQGMTYAAVARLAGLSWERIRQIVARKDALINNRIRQGLMRWSRWDGPRHPPVIPLDDQA